MAFQPTTNTFQYHTSFHNTPVWICKGACLLLPYARSIVFEEVQCLCDLTLLDSSSTSLRTQDSSSFTMQRTDRSSQIYRHRIAFTSFEQFLIRSEVMFAWRHHFRRVACLQGYTFCTWENILPPDLDVLYLRYIGQLFAGVYLLYYLFST